MAFLLQYWTGMRIGELLALTYKDMDLEKRTISVNKSYQRISGRDVITPPKMPKSKRILTLHDLRHSHASLLVEMGFTPSVIAERLGHEKMETTLNTYPHLNPNKQGELADGLEVETGKEEMKMSGVHKYPTIRSHISPREREQIEAKILASGHSQSALLLAHNKIATMAAIFFLSVKYQQ